MTDQIDNAREALAYAHQHNHSGVVVNVNALGRLLAAWDITMRRVEPYETHVNTVISHAERRGDEFTVVRLDCLKDLAADAKTNRSLNAELAQTHMPLLGEFYD